MNTPTRIDNRGICIALIYALVAERLTLYYQHDQHITSAQALTLAHQWLNRSKQEMASNMTKRLVELSGQLTSQISTTLSREAGLHISHEMQESLDTRYHSEIGTSIMDECERLFVQEIEQAA